MSGVSDQILFNETFINPFIDPLHVFETLSLFHCNYALMQSSH